MHLVSVEALNGVELPLSPTGFEELIRAQCEKARTTLKEE